MSWVRVPLSALCLAFAACAPAGLTPSGEETAGGELGVSGPDTGETIVDDEVDSVSVHAGTMKVTLEPTAAPMEDGGVRLWRIRGKTSRNITHVSSFVFDDPFGQASVTGKRTFEIVLSDAYELNSLLSGSPLFVNLLPQTGATQQYTARIDLAPAFARFSGSSVLWVHRDIRPVYVHDDLSSLRYRGVVDSSKALVELHALTGDDSEPEVGAVTARKWELDWMFEGLSLAADPPTDPVSIVGKTPSKTYAKVAGIDVAIARLGLSVHDAEATWPTPACDDAVWECLVDHAGEADLAACGLYRQVTRCLAERGEP
jgi:hypothetical protein